MRIIADRLRELRQTHNKTQLDIAKALNIFDSAYRMYELGTRTPAAEKLVQIADYFNVSVDYLLGRTNNPKIMQDLPEEQ